MDVTNKRFVFVFIVVCEWVYLGLSFRRVWETVRQWRGAFHGGCSGIWQDRLRKTVRNAVHV